MNSIIQLEQLINTNYVRYETLVPLINAQFAGSDADELNIFIDLNSLIKPLTRFKISQLGIDYTDFRLSSCIINMIAHYRRFFRTRYSVVTNFYLIFNTGTDKNNNKICYDYKVHTIEDRKLADYVINNIKASEELCQYIPNSALYIVDTEVGALIDVLVHNGSIAPEIPNLVITKDVCTYQVLSFCDCILRPKKSNGLDTSYMINKNNLLNVLCMERKLASDYSIYNSINMIEYFSFILALTKLPERGLIKSLLSMKDALTIIDRSIKDGKLMGVYNYDIRENLDMLLSIYPSKIGKIYSEVLSRYKVIDLQHQVNNFVIRPDAKLITGPRNYFDPHGIHQVIQTYYSNSNPIQLEDLDY